jgi:hypothetical protein
MARNVYKDVLEPKGRNRIRGGIAIPEIEAPVIEAINLRTDANEAARNATDQYEADVADFKNSQATEAEKGLGSLSNKMIEKYGYDSNESVVSNTGKRPGFYGAYEDAAPYSGGTTMTSPTVISEEPDLSLGTDGQIAQFGDTEGYGIPVDPADYGYVSEQPVYTPPIVDDGTRNIYTGQALGEQYDPKSILESNSQEMREYTRPMSPEEFGSAPGMIYANRGGRLTVGQDNLMNKGLSRLPLNAQNDTLTQIFQSGFRPRR